MRNRGTSVPERKPSQGGKSWGDHTCGLNVTVWDTVQSCLVIWYGSLLWCGLPTFPSCLSWFYLLQTKEFWPHSRHAQRTYYPFTQWECTVEPLLAFPPAVQPSPQCDGPFDPKVLSEDPRGMGKGKMDNLSRSAATVPANLKGHLKLQPSFSVAYNSSRCDGRGNKPGLKHFQPNILEINPLVSVLPYF